MLETTERASLAARLADDKKAEDIMVLDVAGLCMFTDTFVFVTGTSSVQMRAVVRAIRDGFAEAGEGRPIVDGEGASSSWMVLDYGDVVVHVMAPEARSYYQLENLWGDGREVDWQNAEEAEAVAAN